MKKFPIDIETDGLVLEALGLCNVQELDIFIQRWSMHMKDPFVARLVDVYDTDGTLEAYTNTSLYRHKAKQAAEYIITKINEDGEKVMAGYFNLKIHKNIGETFVWIAPPFRKNHLLSQTLNAVEGVFFKAGLENIQTQCYFKNPYFPVICNVMNKNNHQIIKEGQASITWEKTADMWRGENEKTSNGESVQQDTIAEPIYDEEIKTAELKLKVFDPTPNNVITLLKFAKSAFDEKGYRPTCLNVKCLKSAWFALQSVAKLKKEQKFCEYFVHVSNQLVGVFALREEKAEKTDYNLCDIKSNTRMRKASGLYWVHPNFRGKGYMGESLKLVAASFFAHGGDLLSLDIHPDNKASLKVAQKAGFRYNHCVGHYLNRDDFYANLPINAKIPVGPIQIVSANQSKTAKVTDALVNATLHRLHR